MPQYTDQTGRQIIIKEQPKKIISLVPSQTELLYHLGLDEVVSGITKFCIHPDKWFRNKIRVGGTKQLHLDRIKEIAPDLIIANKEENVKEEIDQLALDYPVWVSDVGNLPDAIQMIGEIGRITGKTSEATGIITDINNRFDKLTPSRPSLKVCYLIWQEPYMSVGNDTFIHDMLSRCGFHNIFSSDTRYPMTSLEDIAARECDVIFLASEPFPFNDSHAETLREKLPGIQIELVDGEMFTWYGSRMRQSVPYFQSLIDTLQHAPGAHR